MVPAPTFTRLPTSESPRYERWLALEPAPRRLALTSTKFPTCTSSARRAPGRSRANGPTRQRSPSSASSRCEKASTSVPAPMLTFFSTQFGPTRTLSPRLTRPPNTQLTSIATSRPHSSAPRTSMRAGSASVTPASSSRLASRPWQTRGGCRSEEHTSELQSRRDLVCRLLLEKKKKKQKKRRQDLTD